MIVQTILIQIIIVLVITVRQSFDEHAKAF
jgi:hypothetical protein